MKTRIITILFTFSFTLLYHDSESKSSGARGESRSGKGARCCSDTVIRSIHSRVINPSFPLPDSGSTSYSYRIGIEPKICALRLNFEDVNLDPPTPGSTVCGMDFINVLVPGYPTQPSCGVLNGFGMNYPVREGEEVEILVVAQSRSHYWNIIVSQIECDAIKSRPFEREANDCGVRLRGRNTTTGTAGKKQDLPAEFSSIVVEPSILGCSGGSSTYLRCYLDNVLRNVKKPWGDQSNRVINGRPASRNSWPWQVAFLIKGKFLLCGGALISPTVAITAGHCLSFIQKSLQLSDITVGAGVHRLDGESIGAVYRKCKMIVLHPQHADIHNDISLCIMEEPMPISDRINTVCLPYDKDDTFVGLDGDITGWGKTSDNGNHSSVLQEAKIPIVPNPRCAEAWIEEAGPAFSSIIEDNMICGGGNNQSTCSGDSGGPLTVLKGNRHVLAGLTSFGPSSSCNVPNQPLSVFARVSSHIDFISMAVAEANMQSMGRDNNLVNYLPC